MSGARRARALRTLQAHGYSRIRNLKGGILEWIRKVDPRMPRY
jgi:adenylyltransferase/sulfurtransferase